MALGSAPATKRNGQLAERPVAEDQDVAILREEGVPTVSLLDACASCEEPCDAEDEHETSAFVGLDIDMDSKLLGSLKGNSGRTIIVATGKSDWPHSVTDEKELYAHKLQRAYDTHLESLDSAAKSQNPSASQPAANQQRVRHCLKGISGLGDGISDDGEERLRGVTILCGGQRTYEPDHTSEHNTESILVFPDYKLVANLPKKDAQQAVEEHLSPRILERRGHPSPEAPIRSYLLPYYAVVLICSHKRRDNRCHLTADPLINAMTHAIEALGHEWSVERSGNDDHLLEEREILPSTTEEDISRDLKKLHDPAADKSVGIFKISHVGGHRYAGNVMIWLPNGVNVWYARVRETDAKAIVNETLVKGRVITDLLRGGLGVAGRKGGSVLDW